MSQFTEAQLKAGVGMAWMLRRAYVRRKPTTPPVQPPINTRWGDGKREIDDRE